MNTRPIVTTVILILICLPWSVGAQQSVGVRAGVSADPDQFLFGGHLETGPLLERLVFSTQTEIGLFSTAIDPCHDPDATRCARGTRCPAEWIGQRTAHRPASGTTNAWGRCRRAPSSPIGRWPSKA